MSSYYPEHVYFQSQSSSSAIAQSTSSSSLRRCSVKGCGKDLPQDYALKMCDDCRGRHRKYATTKRAKRKQEKSAVGAQRIGNDDGRVVTWMPPDHHVSLGPIPDDLDPVTNMHVSQIDPRLFNPTSSELAGALTLPPLDSSADLRDAAYSPTSAQIDEIEPASSAARSPAQSRYCSVKGCRTVIGGEYLFKMCVPCRNRYRGYGMTKRSKWKRGREIAAQELDRVRVQEDVRRARQGLPLISQLQASDRRAWERKVSETIPRPPVVQYAPISMLPVRMCTVSHCHTVLQGHYPYRRCERHRLQNRHHSKLKRVRDKEVKSTPLRREGTLNPESLGHGNRKGKARAVEPLYTNEPLNLDPYDLETEEASSETEEIPDESTIPPPARGARRSNTVCSVKWCHNVLDYRSPWKMCETHREKDRMNRKRKFDRDKGIASDVDEEVAGQVVEQASMATDVVESIPEPSGLVLVTPTPAPASDQPVIFMEPLLPPAETLPTIMLQQSEISEYSNVPPRDSSLLPYGPATRDTDVIFDAPDSCEVDIGASSQRSITEEASLEEPCPGNQEVTVHGQQDLSSVVWRSAVSPVSSTSGSDSTSSNSALSSGARSIVTVGADTTSSPATSNVSTIVGLTGTSTSTAHTQPQFQVPYYMPPPFSLPYTPGQPPFLYPSPYSPMPYPLRPTYTYGTPAPGPFQAYQYAPAPPPPGQLAPYALRPYPYPWPPYTNGSIEANWSDASAQAHVQAQVQTKTQRAKRGWGVTDQLGPSEDGLRIVMVQPKGFDNIDIVSSPTSSVTSASAGSRHTQTVPTPGASCSLESSADSSHAEASSTKFTTAAESAPARSCSSEFCRRQIPAEAPGALCERCKIRLKRQLEKTKRRLKLEPRKTRPQSRRLMA